jgi:hypothetical protein
MRDWQEFCVSVPLFVPFAWTSRLDSECYLARLRERSASQGRVRVSVNGDNVTEIRSDAPPSPAAETATSPPTGGEVTIASGGRRAVIDVRLMIQNKLA